MSFKVRIHPTVRQLIRECGFSRSAVVRLYIDLYSQLEAGAPNHRHNRIRGRPDYFRFRRVVVDGGSLHECAFVVEDQADEMAVLWLFHQPRPPKH